MSDHNSAGLEFAKAKDYLNALDAFNAAISDNPTISLYHNNISNVYIAMGNMDKALQHLNEALRIDPFVAEIYNNLGRLYYKQELIDMAIPHFEKALRMNSEYWEAHYNLAHSLVKKNRFYDAATHYRESLRIQPQHPTAHFNLACACIGLGNYLEAYTHLNQTLELEPNHLEALKQLGEVAVLLGKKEEAIHAYQSYLTLQPNAEDIQHNLAVLHLRDEERGKALVGFKKAHDLNPENATAGYMSQALSGEQYVSRAPAEYIEKLFDQYADYYNEQVKSKLHYQVPGLMRSAIAPFLGGNPKAGRILDLGCGTGLCGVFFRDLARELIGVDLSQKMIDKAKLLDTYDELVVSDVEAHLEKLCLKPKPIFNPDNSNTDSEFASPSESENIDPLDAEIDPYHFNTILAGDVFVYIGDLSSIFKYCSNLLALKGFFIFTVEANDSAAYFLQPTGRFAHSSAYIHSLCETHNLQMLLEEDIVPREHEGKAIPGRLYVLSPL